MTVILLVAVLAQALEPTQDDWDWLNEHRQKAFEALMPMRAAPDYPLVRYFRYRDLYQDEPESYFVIQGRMKEAGQAIVITPVGQSIQQQLLEVHMADRDARLETLLEQVEVSRHTLSPKSCPAIDASLKRLDKLRFGTPRRDVIYLHPVVHHLVVDFAAGEFDIALTDDEHPLVRWATRTYQELKRCGEAGTTP